MGYSTERKHALLRKILPQYNRTVLHLVEEKGFSMGGTYQWRKAVRANGQLLPGYPPTGINGRNTRLDELRRRTVSTPAWFGRFGSGAASALARSGRQCGRLITAG